MDQRRIDLYKAEMTECRKRFARGPWDNEPDRIEFTHVGFACLIVRNHTGTLCGYVGVPEDHPCYKKDYSEVDVDVHGGLTFAAACQVDGPICHIPEPGMTDNVWWFGFDTGHFMDISPSMLWMEQTYTELGEIADAREKRHEEFNQVFGHNDPMKETYKDIAYVTGEVKSLAEQLKEKKP
jgi:hypothetical protein